MWKIWKPELDLPIFMYAKSTFINKDGELILGFEDEEKRKITFSFTKGFLSNRETDEGAFMKTLEDLYTFNSNDVEKSNLFETDDSEYLSWFKKTLEFNKEIKIKHYVIIAYDIISEVISTTPPIINIEG